VRRDSFGRPALSLLALAAASLVVLVFFLSLYPLRHLRVPIGWDSVDYIWRTRLAQKVGIANIRTAVPARMFVKEARPAFPVVAATLSSLGGVSVIMETIVLPAVVAAAAGLAGGTLIRRGGGLPAWSLPAGAVVVGTSMNAVLMVQYGYFDNLMITAVFLVAAVALLAALEDRWAVISAMFLLGVGGLIHGALFVLAVAIVAVTAVLFVPRSWRGWRMGVKPLDTPTGRLGAVVVGAVAVAAAALYATFRAGPTPRLNRPEVGKKLRADLPRYGLPWLLPLAAGGAFWLSGGDRWWPGTTDPAGPRNADRRRSFLLLLGSWAGVALGGYLAYRVTSLPIPANRFLLFGLGLPILAFLGVVGVARWVGRRRKSVEAVIVLAVVALAVMVSFREWHGTVSSVDPVKLRQAAIAEAYLRGAGVPNDRPVVFIVDDRGPLPATTIPFMRDHLFAAFPTDRLAHVYVYLGSPQDFLAGRPASSPPSHQYEVSSQRLFAVLQPALRADPVALIVESYNETFFGPWVGAHPQSRVGAGPVAVVQGPPPPAAIPAPHPVVPNPTFPKLMLIGVGTLLVLGLVGLGWTWVLLGRWMARQEVLASAPAVGLAVLTLGGALADAAGIRLAGAAGAVIPVVLAALGLGTAAIVRARGAGQAEKGAEVQG
jgi:hypothetical protein